jgi:hypothetical protein
MIAASLTVRAERYTVRMEAEATAMNRRPGLIA